MKLNKKLYLYFIAPFSVLFTYRTFLIEWKTICSKINTDFLGFVPVNMVRAFASLSLGCLLYLAIKQLRQIHWSDLAKRLFPIASFSLFLVTVLYSLRYQNYIHCLFILIGYSLAITLAFADPSPIPAKGLVAWLGKFSLYLYLVHYSAIHLTERYVLKPISADVSNLLVLPIAFLLAFLLMKLTEFIHALHLFERLKKYFIMEA